LPPSPPGFSVAFITQRSASLGWLRKAKTLNNALDAKSGTAKGAPFVVVFISEIIIAWVLYGILLHMNMFSVRAGIISAAFCWFGFALTTIATNNAFQARRVMLTVIDSIAWLGAFLIIGAIVGGWGP
jgi:hypothetical protein